VTFPPDGQRQPYDPGISTQPHVPRIERPFWVCEQLEVALFEGLAGRVAALITRKRYSHRRSAQERGRAHMLLNTGDVTPVVWNVNGLEHADILAEALSTARHRLLIISPFAANAVVNRDFIAKLKQGLRTGVEITIACGYGGDNSCPGKYALRRLSKLAARYDRFTFARIKNLHAKILICDSTCVSTSYNWLSFRSDSDQSCCIEVGTLEIFTDRVDERYAQYRSLVDEKGVLYASQQAECRTGCMTQRSQALSSASRRAGRTAVPDPCGYWHDGRSVRGAAIRTSQHMSLFCSVRIAIGRGPACAPIRRFYTRAREQARNRSSHPVTTVIGLPAPTNATVRREQADLTQAG
jgi:PLD-like domain